jgi:hypothetical protein
MSESTLEQRRKFAETVRTRVRGFAGGHFRMAGSGVCEQRGARCRAWSVHRGGYRLSATSCWPSRGGRPWRALPALSWSPRLTFGRNASAISPARAGDDGRAQTPAWTAASCRSVRIAVLAADDLARRGKLRAATTPPWPIDTPDMIAAS